MSLLFGEQSVGEKSPYNTSIDAGEPLTHLRNATMRTINAFHGAVSSLGKPFTDISDALVVIPHAEADELHTLLFEAFDSLVQAVTALRAAEQPESSPSLQE